jgi:hypothetical protein
MKYRKQNINENQIAKDAAKRFRMLYEYSFNITEDDEEPSDQNNDQSPMNQNGPDQNMDMGANQDALGNEPMPQDDGMPQDAGMPQNPEQQGGVEGLNPDQSGMDEPIANGDTDDSIETEPMQQDDEVIDIDDLTDSQEKTEEKVEDVQKSMKKGFDKLLDVVSKLNKMIDNNTANMESLKQEIEKRNPTSLEKLNMRTANDSYPFNVSPSDYWKEKELTSNYRINDDDKEKEYTITQGDIDSITDFRTISQDLNDTSFNQNLLNIFGLK